MNNYLQPGDVLTHTPAGAVASSAAVAIGTMIGVAQTSASASVAGEFRIRGVVRLPKATGFAPAQGASLIFRPSTGGFVATAQNGDIVGGAKAAKAALTGDTAIEALLCPEAGVVQSGL
jgi:predicted RecA/RadA family phage recombinase